MFFDLPVAPGSADGVRTQVHAQQWSGGMLVKHRHCEIVQRSDLVAQRVQFVDVVEMTQVAIQPIYLPSETSNNGHDR